jgi:hypothetical protein
MALKIFNGISANNQRVTDVADPTAATDGVNLQYLQNFIAGLAWKDEVRAASTGNINTASPGASLDGVTLATNDRILLKDQTNAAQNGIYVWTGSAAALTRSFDADSTTDLRSATVTVAEGTVNADKVFTQTAEIATVGTTNQTWVVGPSGGVTYTAGNGISLGSNAITVVADPAAGAGITVTASGVKLDTAVAVRKYAASIGNGSLTTIAVTHNLGTQDITWSVRQTSDQAFVLTDAVATDANTLTLTFASAPASNALRVVVHA